MKEYLDERRSANDRMKADKLKLGQESWTHGQGSYDAPFFADPEAYSTHNVVTKRETPEQLIGTEKVLFNVILNRLKDASEQKPVIVVDFGGMFGLSFIRIAKSLERMGQYISHGRVALVVTNLAFDPEKPFENTRAYSELGEMNKPFFRENFRLVHYIKGDAELLRTQMIQVGGNEMILQGNVDILHECDALAHGLINDIDIPHLASLLSQDGTMFIAQGGLYPTTLLTEKRHAEARDKAHYEGIRSIRDLDVHMLPLPKSSRYLAFYKGQTPPQLDLNVRAAWETAD